METAVGLSSRPHFFKKGIQEFSIQTEQDGLFFGLEFLKDFFKSDNDSPEITAYLQEGECVFKGQILMRIHLKNKRYKMEDIVPVVSYLSGAYTLISCFTERNFDFSVMACSTPRFSLSEWEEKAILGAGGLIQKSPEDISCYSENDVHQALEKGGRQIVLSCLKMSKKKIRDILQSLPHSVEPSLQGPFFPYDLEGFRDFHLKSVYPICLQGCFPQLKMKICAEE